MTAPPTAQDRIAASLTALIDTECDRRAREHQRHRATPIPRSLTFLPASPSGKHQTRHAVVAWRRRTEATDRWWTPGQAICSRSGDDLRSGLKADSHLGLEVVTCAQCRTVLDAEGVGDS